MDDEEQLLFIGCFLAFTVGCLLAFTLFIYTDDDGNGDSLSCLTESYCILKDWDGYDDSKKRCYRDVLHPSGVGYQREYSGWIE
jgi:hypothetical protein